MELFKKKQTEHNSASTWLLPGKTKIVRAVNASSACVGNTLSWPPLSQIANLEKGAILARFQLGKQVRCRGKWWVAVMAVPLLYCSCGVHCCHQHIQVPTAIVTANVRREDVEKQPFVTMPHVFRYNVWKSASKILQDQSMFTLLGNSHFPLYPSISCITSREILFLHFLPPTLTQTFCTCVRFFWTVPFPCLLSRCYF